MRKMMVPVILAMMLLLTGCPGDSPKGNLRLVHQTFVRYPDGGVVSCWYLFETDGLTTYEGSYEGTGFVMIMVPDWYEAGGERLPVLGTYRNILHEEDGEKYWEDSPLSVKQWEDGRVIRKDGQEDFCPEDGVVEISGPADKTTFEISFTDAKGEKRKYKTTENLYKVPRRD